jgi:arginase
MQNQFILTPFFLDQPSPGLEAIAQPGWNINNPALPDGNVKARLSSLHQPIADFVAGAIARGERPVSIAGDCCTAIGVLAGLQRAGLDPLLIWLDAHGDFNTWETTPSGFLGGMPLAMLVGRGEQTLVQVAGLLPLSESQVILTDGRDLDPGERQALAGSDVIHLADSCSLLEHTAYDRPVHIHFDTDIIDPNDAPAMSYPAPGGPTAVDLQAIFRALAIKGQITAVSMSTWNPELDADGRSQAVCMQLLHTLIEK